MARRWLEPVTVICEQGHTGVGLGTEFCRCFLQPRLELPLTLG